MVVLTSGSSTSGAGQLFQAVLRPVPDNHVTGSGTAAVTLHGDVATFTVDTTGLLNGGSHPMHLHAFGEGICPPASAAKLYNGHLAISTTDGLKYYGPMAAALTLSGDTSMNSMLAFSRYPTTREHPLPAHDHPHDRRGQRDPQRQRGGRGPRHRLRPQRPLRHGPEPERTRQRGVARCHRSGAVRDPAQSRERRRKRLVNEHACQWAYRASSAGSSSRVSFCGFTVT